MKTYLVGGAVRDELLGLEVTERDWVVVGATPEQMLDLGYTQVGKSFPVFLHPETKDEYALARTERKTGKGYYGFECAFSPDVTLEEDLMRRDLTINAIAKDEQGELFDPYGGLADLKAKKLKHVSQAFVEDPVRILRIARFMARFEPQGFSVDDSTIALMREMVEDGEVDSLIPERIVKELLRSLELPSPVSFVKTLRKANALSRIMPELDKLYGVPQRADYHPEVDTGVHMEMVIIAATKLSDDPQVRFAAMMHDLGKATTPEDVLPSHYGHEGRGVKIIKKLCQRLKVPNDYRDLAAHVAYYHGMIHKATELTPAKIVQVLEKTDAYRKPERFKQILVACEADSRGRKGFEERDYPQADYLWGAFEASKEIEMQSILEQTDKGEVIKAKIHQARVTAVKQFLSAQKKPR